MSEASRSERDFSWDSKWPAVYVLFTSRLDGDAELVAAATRLRCEPRVLGDAGRRDGAERQRYTPGGLAFYRAWGSLRYAAGAALLAARLAALPAAERAGLYQPWGPPSPARRLGTLARSQANYILGNNPAGRSFLTGFGNGSAPTRTHHRWASGIDGLCAYNRLNADGVLPNQHELRGALVGGPYCGEEGTQPWECDGYDDRRQDVVRNEVAIDYNAAATVLFAALATAEAETTSEWSSGDDWCEDLPDFDNGQGLGCENYVSAGFCAGGDVVPGQEWAMGETFNYSRSRAARVAAANPGVGTTCCVWPRAPDLSNCSSCESFADPDNWISLSADNCLFEGHIDAYTWCGPIDDSTDDAFVNGTFGEAALALRPPRTETDGWSILIFVIELIVAFSSFVAAFASLEKLFVLYTWAYFKMHPEDAPEKQWKCESKVDDATLDDRDAAAALPRVCVQCPIYNDREVCERVIDAACRLRYPKSKLEVFVMDDSTDEITKGMIDERVAYWTAHGVDIQPCRRPNRKGFKAGNMLAFHHLVTSEYIAIFDSDFIPYPDFLQRTVPYLLDNPELGFVQGRWTYINQDESTFTRWVEITLNQHIKGEQYTRSACRTFLQFNGSGGLWRKACMDSSGGWNDETLVEDMDLSLRGVPHRLARVVAPRRAHAERAAVGVRAVPAAAVPLGVRADAAVQAVRALHLGVAPAAAAQAVRRHLLLLGALDLAHRQRLLLHAADAADLGPALHAARARHRRAVVVGAPPPRRDDRLRHRAHAALAQVRRAVRAVRERARAAQGVGVARGDARVQGGFKWPVTNKTGRSKRRGFSLDIDWKALRAKIFLRECVIGAYLLFMGAWLSYNLQAFTLFWFYGIYIRVQGIVYLIFGLSVVDNLNFEPELPEAMRPAVPPRARGCTVEARRRPQGARARPLFLYGQGGRLAGYARWGASLPRATPLSLAGLQANDERPPEPPQAAGRAVGGCNGQRPPAELHQHRRARARRVGRLRRRQPLPKEGGERHAVAAVVGHAAGVGDRRPDGRLRAEDPPRRRRRSRPRRSRRRRRRPSRRRRRRRRSSRRIRTTRAATRATTTASERTQSVPPPLVTTGSVRDNPFLRRDSKADPRRAVGGGRRQGPASAVRLAGLWLRRPAQRFLPGGDGQRG